jgi:ubiquinone/menaquinone biosynthesis C-methylase UbiE
MKKLLKKSYNLDSENYDFKFKEVQFEKYRKLLSENKYLISPITNILDLGCGTGLLIDYLKTINLFYNNIYGVDFSEKLIKNARDKGECVAQGDIVSLPFKNNSFYSILSFTVLRIIPDYEEIIFKEINRIIVTNGYFAVSILKNRYDESFLEHLKGNGFFLKYSTVCGQDIGFISQKK